MSGLLNNVGSGGVAGAGGAPLTGRGLSSGGAGGGNFADVLKGQIDEVVKLQQDASKAVEDLSLGKTDDVTGVMTAMEKSDAAFKTLLAIRSKLMEAYDEVKNLPL
jgi:flagellar hook-basal body complex protein FliE